MKAARRTHLGCVLGCLFGTGYAIAASAGTAPQLSFRDCPPSDASDINRLVTIDASGSSSGPELTGSTVVVSCRGARYDVEVSGAAGAKTMRSIDLQQTAATARTRLVAIAVVELLAAQGSTERQAPPSGPLIAPPSPVPPPPPQQREERSSPPAAACCIARAEAVGSARVFNGGVALVGGGLRAVFGRFFPIGIDILAEYGSPSTAEGTVKILSVTGGVTYGAELALGNARVRAAAGARGGAARLTGEPNDAALVVGASRTAAWGGPMAELAVAWAPSGSLLGELAVEAGYPVFPVYALVLDQRELGLHGAWIAAKLGIGFGQ